LKDEVFCEIFGDSRGSGAGIGAGMDEDDGPGVQESVCRFCFSSEGELISPCLCRGSNEWVHLKCLQAWQKQVLLDQPTHPKYQSSIDRICNVCLEPFTGKGIPPSRHEQILSFTGAEIPALIKPGNLLVKTRESSRDNLELIAQHPEIKQRLGHWTQSVFLMLSKGRSDNGLLAVSMSKPIPGPPNDADLGFRERRLWAARTKKGNDETNFYKIRHWDGGPMHREMPFAVAHIPNSAAWAQEVDVVTAIPPDWVFGSFEAVATALKTIKKSSKSSERRTINCVWGCGGWGGTQVLAEIARGGWGLVTVEQYLAIRPDKDLEMDWLLDFEWNRIVEIAKTAPESEYTRRRR
jgi:putative AlgH/UPF0301 family transcriptional regulator